MSAERSTRIIEKSTAIFPVILINLDTGDVLKGANMTQAQRTQKIYALGSRLGLLQSGSKDDLLHNLVFRLTGQKHISCLTEAEYKTVISDLYTQLKINSYEEPPHPNPQYEAVPGMMSVGQQKMVWKLMYQLKELDFGNQYATLGNRLCGIIKKELHTDATAKQPFRWLTYAQGSKLIESLKKYINSAQRRKENGKHGKRTADKN